MLEFNIYNHIFAVEFETFWNFEFVDINDNCFGPGRSP